jgi:sigma-B regulation protein RsbU (phosphoserine phosphatase)
MADRILVVDDEPALELLIRQKFRNQIRSNELAFSFAGDGEEALDQLRDHPDIGIVLTDINMPRMDGLTLLVKLRDLDRTVRAVVVSAYGDLKNIRTAMNRGAFDFVTKPIDFTDLETTIRKSIGDLHVYLEAETAHALLATIQKELDIARRIQETALPKDYPQDPNLDVYGFMISSSPTYREKAFLQRCS